MITIFDPIYYDGPPVIIGRRENKKTRAKMTININRGMAKVNENWGDHESVRIDLVLH